MELSANEKIIKTWEYASANSNTHASLLVTNKRIIAKQTSNRSIQRDEIALSDVQSLSMNYMVAGKVKAILLILLGLATAIFGVVSTIKSQSFENDQIFLLIVLLAIALGLVACGIAILKQCAFKVFIYTRGNREDSLCIGASSLRKKRSAKSKNVSVRVDKEIAKDIIETLGAITLGNS